MGEKGVIVNRTRGYSESGLEIGNQDVGALRRGLLRYAATMAQERWSIP